jgi:hypothetical protein
MEDESSSMAVAWMVLCKFRRRCSMLLRAVLPESHLSGDSKDVEAGDGLGRDHGRPRARPAHQLGKERV